MARARAETRDNAKAAIASALAKHGKGYDWNRLRERYPDVPKTTFYRWMRQVEESGIPAQRTMRSARAAVTRKKRRIGDDQISSEIASEVVSKLPAVPSEKNLADISIHSLLTKLYDCVKNADDLLVHARGQDGSVRNAKLILNASEHMRRSAETISKIHTMVWDVHRTERLHQLIFDRLRQRDPELVQLILQDLKAVNLEFGLS